MRTGTATAAFFVLTTLWVGACGSGQESPGAPVIGDPDQEYLEISEEVYGFVGYWFDPAANTYYVNSKNPNIDLEALKEALIERDPSRAEGLESAEFEVNHVAYLRRDLREWQGEVQALLFRDPAFRHCLFGNDLDEMHDRVVFWVSCKDEREAVVQMILDEVDAPLGAVVVIYQESSGDDDG